MKLPRTKVLFVSFVLALIVSIPAVVSAQSSPPHAFAGFAYIDNGVAPQGTIVHAVIDDIIVGQSSADASGTHLVHLYPPASGASFAGKTITFGVRGLEASETGTWVGPGHGRRLDLHAWTSQSTNTPTPTPSQTTTDPALQRYADDNAGGPGAIYVGDISQLAGPAPDNDTSLGDRNGMVPLADLRDHRWLYESGYYRSLLDRANLTNPTPLTSSRANIQLQYACINRALLSCRLVEKYWAPNLEARTNGQLTLEVVSFPELGVAGPDTLELVSNGTLDMAEIYAGYVSHQLPLLELQFLTSLYPDQETMFNSVAEMLPRLEEAVQGATGGGLTINHNWYSGNDIYIFADKPLQTVGDFDGLSTRSISSTMSDWLGGMGAEAQFIAFAKVYTALERGIIDAAVTGPDAAFGQRWYEVVDYMNGPLTSFLATHNVVNADVWEAIPADLQQILVEEGAKAELEAMRLASVQNLESVRKNIEAGLEVVEFPPEVKERSFDVALIQHVIPGWLHRLDYPNEGDQAVEVFNEHVGPFVGLRIQSGGSVEKTGITKGPHFAMADRAALVALYNATGGPNWNSNNNWLSDVPISEWSGVTTDDNGRVTELDLSQNQLTGPIPPALGNLSNLQALYLWGNQLTGPIPPELARLTNLEVLDLSQNQLTGPIPPALGNLSNLQWLYLSGNQLTGPIPAELGNLSNLQELGLSGNQLTGPIPASLGNLSNLQELYLWGNQLTGEIPAELGPLTNLTVLYLSGNQLTGCVPGSLRDVADNDFAELELPFCASQDPLITLYDANGDGAIDISELFSAIDHYFAGRIDISQLFGVIELYFSAPTEPGPGTGTPEGDRAALVALYNATVGPNWDSNDNWLSDVPISEWSGVTTDDNGRVTGLDLRQNQLRGEISPELGNLANLQELYLHENQLSGEIPPELGNLASLNWLRLNENQLSGEIPPELGNLASLNWLRLNENQLSGEIPPELGNLASLNWLRLNENQLSGEIPPELGNLASLTWLNLRQNQLSGEIPPELGNLASLNWLRLNENQLSGEIPPELGNLASLNWLRLNENQLSGEIPPELGNLASLTWLNLRQNQLSGEIPPELGNLANLSGEIPPELGCDMAVPPREPVERGDTAGVGQPRQPDRAVPRREPVERGDTAGVGQPRQPDRAVPRL